MSQTVLLYLTAIDVRASSEGEVEGTTYSTEEGASYPVPAYSSPGYSDEGVYYDDGGSYEASKYDSAPHDSATPGMDAGEKCRAPAYVKYSYASSCT